MTWIVAVSHPQREFRALASLQDHGFWAWLPTRTVTRRPKHMKGREIARQYPLFGGGYVFVWEAPRCCLVSRRPTARDFYGVDDIRGVICSTVGETKQPLRIGDDDMDALRDRIDNPPAVPIIEDAWSIGENVFVSDGPFASFPGTVEAWDGHRGWLKVLVNIFGRKTPVTLDTAQVERRGARRAA